MLPDSERQMSFVVPLALHERCAEGSWRSVSNDNAICRFRLLVSTFLRSFYLKNLHSFQVICPPEDISAITQLIDELTQDRRFQVTSELDLCPGIPEWRKQGAEGWKLQQIIKLAAHKVIDTKFYVTLDSDIVCVRPFSFDSLIRRERALTNIEKPADYRRLYVTQFAETETAIKRGRLSASACILDYARSSLNSWRFFGETPVVLHRRSVELLVAKIEARADRPWAEVLASRRGWTEYTLYFQYLEMTKQLRKHHRLVSCNAILDLENSIWQPTRLYRERRVYDRAYFSRCTSVGRGIFLAIQSWLPEHAWLPDEFNDVGDFYAQLEKWLHDA